MISTHAHFHRIIVFFTFLVTVSPCAVLADDSAKIDYQRISKNKVVFIVRVSSPPPSSVIVQHFHPRGNALVASSPRAQQISNNKGYAKWLLKNVRPGVYPFSLTFTENVRPGDIQLMIRYRNPRDGGFQELRTRP